MPFFQRAATRIKGRTVQLDDLYYYLGDCLAQAGRLEEAEQAFLEEMKLFPNLIHARTGVAMLYEASGRTPDADRAVSNMLAAVPTPETYKAAARVAGESRILADRETPTTTPRTPR